MTQNPLLIHYQAWYGYDQGIISGILISSDFIDAFPQTKDPDIQGITASCFSLGNLVGCLLAALFGDRLGRKNTLRWGAVISALGAILQFAAVNFPMLILGRVINGFGNGKHFPNVQETRIDPSQVSYLVPSAFTKLSLFAAQGEESCRLSSFCTMSSST